MGRLTGFRPFDIQHTFEQIGLYTPPPDYPEPTAEEQALTTAQTDLLNTLLAEYEEEEEPSELELAGETVGLLALERQEQALLGTLELPVGFEERKEETMTKLELKLSMEGKRPGSSAWNNAMAEFESKWAMAADAIRHGEITGLTGVTGLQQEYAWRREEDPFRRGAGLLGGLSGLTGYYSGERGMQYSGQLMSAAEWNRTMRSMGETAGFWTGGAGGGGGGYSGQGTGYGQYGGGLYSSPYYPGPTAYPTGGQKPQWY